MPVVARILVPDSTRSRLLVVLGDRPALPGWTIDDFETEAGIREAQALGIPSPYLRPMRYDGEPAPGATVRTLDEYEAPPAGWEPEPPLAWLPFDRVNRGERRCRAVRRVGRGLDPRGAIR